MMEMSPLTVCAASAVALLYHCQSVGMHVHERFIEHFIGYIVVNWSEFACA